MVETVLELLADLVAGGDEAGFGARLAEAAAGHFARGRLSRKRRATPRFDVAILVSSIAVNVTELFPINIVLGFWLAHAARERESHEHTG